MDDYKQKRAALVGPLVEDPNEALLVWNERRNSQIQFLLSQGLKPDHYLLDIGCGVLRGGIPIIQYLDSKHYYGMEKCDERLEEAKRELAEEGLRWKVPHLTTTYQTIDEKFDFIWVFQVFIHLTDEILMETLSNISHLLKCL